MQAVQASDYAIAQFRFLKRLLLVHGRWNYSRVAMVILYCFYKNVGLTFSLCLFNFYNGFSGTTLYESMVQLTWNVAWTFLPVLWIGMTDKDIGDHEACTFPIVYQTGIDRMLFNRTQFVMAVLNGVWHGTICFFVVQMIWTNMVVNSTGETEDLLTYGSTTYATMVITVNLKIALQCRAWNRLTYVVVFGSIIGYLIFLTIYSSMQSFFIGFFGVSSHVFNKTPFWLCCLVTPMFALAGDYALEGFRRMGVPLPYMVIQEMAKGYGNAGMLGKGMLSTASASPPKDASDRAHLTAQSPPYYG
jgi:magnesium-transporting ATPase (P-type)